MTQMSVEKAVELAEQFKSRGKPAEAEHVFRQIIAASPQNALVLNRLGICVAEAGRLAEARDIFLRAVEADPALAAGWENLSLAYEHLDDLDNAIAARRKAIEINMNHAEDWHRLGTCFGKKGDFGSAIEPLRKSVELDPNINGSHHDLVLALARNGEPEAAEEAALRRIGMIKTVDPEMVRPVADCFKNARKFDRATEMWRRVVAADPRCYEAVGQLAMCLITQGDYENGWRLYECRWDCDTFRDNARRDPLAQWGRDPVGKPDVADKTILIYSEQGIGDTIQFARYANIFAQRVLASSCNATGPSNRCWKNVPA